MWGSKAASVRRPFGWRARCRETPGRARRTTACVQRERSHCGARAALNKCARAPGCASSHARRYICIPRRRTTQQCRVASVTCAPWRAISSAPPSRRSARSFFGLTRPCAWFCLLAHMARRAVRFGVLGVRDEHAEAACSECRRDTLQCARVGVRSVRSGMLTILQHAWCMRLHSLPSHARCAGRSWLLRAQERQRTMCRCARRAHAPRRWRRPRPRRSASFSRVGHAVRPDE